MASQGEPLRRQSSLINYHSHKKSWLPDEIFGWDTDEIFAFSTNKTVWIRDRWIGFAYCLLFLAVLFWVVFGQILWRNEHFMYKDVQGVARIWYDHPASPACKSHCQASFRKLEDLSYCVENPQVEADRPAPCRYADKRTLAPMGDVSDSLFFPTSVRHITEKRVCNPQPENHFSCASEYKEVEEGQEEYYADVENFVVQVVSSYKRDSISGSSLDHQGYFVECAEGQEASARGWASRLEHNTGSREDRCGGRVRRTRLHCKEGDTCNRETKELPPAFKDVMPSQQAQMKNPQDHLASQVKNIGRKFRGRDSETARQQNTRDEETFDCFGSSMSDNFKIRKLLELADIDLDKHTNADGKSVRQAGTVIEIEAEYNNMYHIASSFGYQPVEYTYRISERTMPYVSREYLDINQPPNYPETRRYVVENGLMLVFKVSGQFGFFNIVYLFLMLATSLALLATAAKATEIFAIYGHSRNRNYFHLKYEVSPDFSECWECSVCGYHNTSRAAECEGVDKWCSPKDVGIRKGLEKCKGRRPKDWPVPES